MARRSRRAKVRHRKSKRGSEGIPMRNYRRRLARRARKYMRSSNPKRMHKKYYKALAVDRAFHNALVKIYGKRAGDARYDRVKNRATPELRRLGELKEKYDASMLRSMSRGRRNPDSLDAFQQWMLKSNIARIKTGEWKKSDLVKHLRAQGYVKLSKALQATKIPKG